MSRRHRQLRVRDPDVFLLLPTTPLTHRHTRILRTVPVDHTVFSFRYPDFHHGLIGCPRRGRALSGEFLNAYAEGYFRRLLAPGSMPATWALDWRRNGDGGRHYNQVFYRALAGRHAGQYVGRRQ